MKRLRIRMPVLYLDYVFPAKHKKAKGLSTDEALAQILARNTGRYAMGFGYE